MARGNSRPPHGRFALKSLVVAMGLGAGAVLLPPPIAAQPAQRPELTAVTRGDQGLLGDRPLLNSVATGPGRDPLLPLRRHDIVFVDPRVLDFQRILANLHPHAEVVVLDGRRDGLRQIAAALERRRGLASIQIVSHGASGMLLLGSTPVYAGNLDNYRPELAALRRALAQHGDLLLYGCDVASGAEGAAFMATLARATGADVAASADPTGGAAAGADWELEITTGNIEATPALSAAALDDYPHRLATLTVTSNADSGPGTLRNAIAAANHTDTITFNAGMTITLSSGELSFGKTITIDGDLNNDGTPDVTIDANYRSRVFSITSGTVRLEGLVLTHGALWGNGGATGPQGGGAGQPGGSALGAAIHNAANLTLNSVKVELNAAAAGGGGGGNSGAGGGGGGGGSGFGGFGGGTGGSASDGTGYYAGVAGGGGSGGRGGGFSPDFMGGRGGTSGGGGAGGSYSGYPSGGSGGTATASGQTIGGGGGGVGWYAAGAAGGGAAGAIYNTGTIAVIGTSPIINNLGAGGGGGSSHDFNAGAGGIGVGGIWNAGGTINMTAANYAAMTGNAGSGGSGGVSVAGASGAAGSSVARIHNVGGTVDTAYVPDTTPPAVLSIDRSSPAGALTNADTLVFQVAFSEAVSNLSTGDFAVTGTTAIVTSVNTVVGNTYNCTISGGDLANFNGAVTLGFSAGQNITDAAGNPLTDTTPTGTNNNTYTVDNTAPAAPSAPDMTAGSDSGSSNTDNITSDTTPTFTGTAEADATVKLYTGGSTLVATVTADGSGNWSATTSALAAGTHTVTATATDGATNVSAASTGLAITIDTSAAAPSAPDLAAGSDTGSSSTDNITSDATPTVTGSAEAGATVTLYDTDGTTAIGSATADGSGNWSITSSTLAAGAHTLTAKQTDLAGHTSVASAGLAITIDTTAPAAPTVSAVSTDTGSSNSDEITSDTTLVISGTAEANAILTLYRNGVSIGTTTANGLGNWAFDYTGTTLAQGSYNFTATATDTGGNTSAVSAALAVTVDTTAAAPTGLDLAAASDSGSSNSDNITSDTTPTVTGGAESGAAVTLYDSDGTTVLGTTTADGTGSWSITSSALGAGSHSLTAKQTDIAGNTSAASAALAVTVDTSAAAPSAPDLAAASDTGSSNSDNITSDTTPTLTGTGEAGAAVTLYDSDGTTALGSATADGGGNWSITSSVLAAGAHTLTAKQTDLAGNTSVASAGLAITIDTSAPGAPSAPDLAAGSDSGSSSTDDLTNDTTPTFTGTAEAGATVTLYDTDGVTLLGTSTADGAGNWSITSSALSAGSHTLTAKQADAAGNASAASASLAIVIDTSAAAPSAPDLDHVSDSGSSNSDNLTFDTTPTLNGSGADAGALVALYDTDGTTVLGTASADGSGNWTITSSVLGAGGHTLTAKQTDTAGNLSAASAGLAVTIDTSAAAPSAPDLAAASDTGTSNSDNVTADTTPTVTGTGAEAGATVMLYDTDGDTVIGSATADGGGGWSITSSVLGAGAHTLRARQYDVAGNGSVLSAGLALTLDTSAPVTTLSGLQFSADTGTSASDFITNTAAQTIGATLSAGLAAGDAVWGSLNNGTSWSNITASVSGTTLSWNGVTLTGSNTLRLKVSDLAGNDGPVASQAYVLDQAAPATTIASAVFSNDTGTSSSDFITTTAAQTISGTLSANLAAGERVEVSLNNGGSWSTATAATGDNDWSIDVTLSASNTLRVRVSDTAGNNGAAWSQAYVLAAATWSGTAAAALAYDNTAGTALHVIDTAANVTSAGVAALIANGVTEITLTDDGFVLLTQAQRDALTLHPGSGAFGTGDEDEDGDGMPNGFELTHGLDPMDAADALGDLDGDGLTNLVEYLGSTDVAVATPDAQPDSYETTVGGTLNVDAAGGVLANDTDVSGNPLTAQLISGPSHAASFSFNPDGSFDYVQDGSATASDSFDYRVSNGLDSSMLTTATIEIPSAAPKQVLEIRPSAHRFPAEGGSAEFVVTNIGSAPVTLAAATLSGARYSVGADGCSGTVLAADASCSVSVDFTGDGAARAGLLQVTRVGDGEVITAFLTNRESVAEEARRRVPATLAALDGLPAELQAGQSYTVSWSVLSYDPSLRGNLVLFDCGAAASCGAAYGEASRFAESGYVAPALVEEGDWNYNGERAVRLTYRYDFTPDPARFTTAKTIVLRFYTEGSGDIAAGKVGVSTLIPGGLDGETYVGSDGRRLSRQVNP